jgi:hypothetical protein
MPIAGVQILFLVFAASSMLQISVSLRSAICATSANKGRRVPGRPRVSSPVTNRP